MSRDSRQRVRLGLRAAWAATVRMGAAAAPEAGEFWLLAGLLLLAAGLWLVWTPGAFLGPALVLIWIYIPQRTPFIARPAPSPKHERSA